MLAFEFLVLTAARSGEARNARWEEIDHQGAVRVPLSDRAIEVLDDARELADSGGIVFPSPTGRALGRTTMSALLHALEIDAVPHGFRSSFRDWAAGCTGAPPEVSELALAHVNSDRIEAAYRRRDLFERRRELMQAWSDYLAEAIDRALSSYSIRLRRRPSSRA